MEKAYNPDSNNFAKYKYLDCGAYDPKMKIKEYTNIEFPDVNMDGN